MLDLFIRLRPRPGQLVPRPSLVLLDLYDLAVFVDLLDRVLLDLVGLLDLEGLDLEPRVVPHVLLVLLPLVIVLLLEWESKML